LKSSKSKFKAFRTDETSGFKDNSLTKSTGRGAQSNFSSRFSAATQVGDLENYGWFDEAEEKSLLRTEFLKDSSRSIVTENNSPDLGFGFGLNPYRGCEHGCAYCFARPTHEYLGLSPGLDFESKIFVKFDAPELLRKKLLSPSWRGELIFMSGVTDCYQPAERKFEITRGCLKVLAEFRNPVSIITKNQLVRRDIDLLQELTKYNAVRVYLSVTSLDVDLARVLEPRTSVPQARLNTIEALAKAGIPVGVNVAPVIPGLTDHEPAILKAAADAGATHAGYIFLRLPSTVAPIFMEWLTTNRPDRKDRVLNSIRAIKNGQLNISDFGARMRGTGPQAEHVKSLFKIFSEKYGLNKESVSLSSEHFRKVTDQMTFEIKI
jgi:DNA repair photolyase